MRLLIVVLLIVAAAAGATQWRAAQRERRAEAAYPPQGRFVSVDGLRVHSAVLGEGPDLVLLHGLSGNARDLTFGLAGQLAGRYRVIVFDRPGLGWSDPLPRGREGLQDQARHLAEAARQLGAERPIVVGHSYGGSVALAWAVYQPDRIAALVTLAGPSHDWDTPTPWFYRITANPVGSALFVPLVTAWVPEQIVDRAIADTFAPQAMPAGYDRDLGAALTLRRASLRANARHRARLRADIVAMQPLYPGLKLPFELLHGTADDTVGYDIHAVPMARAAPGVHLVRLDGLGHMLQHIAIPEVVAAIDRAAGRDRVN